MSIHYFLRSARRLSGLSLRQAARQAGLLPSTLYRYEEGIIQKVPAETAQRLLSLYGTDPLSEYRSFRLQKMAERIQFYAESRQLITADFLMEKYLAADERGRQTILDILMLESRYSSCGRFTPGEEKP